MNSPKHPDIADFKAWAELAQNDPAGFEAAREAAVAALLAQAPTRYRKRLEGLQWRIDRIREQADNPMAACVKLSRLMWDNVLGPSGLVEHIRQLNESGSPIKPGPSAQVLPFAQRSERNAEE